MLQNSSFWPECTIVVREIACNLIMRRLLMAPPSCQQSPSMLMLKVHTVPHRGYWTKSKSQSEWSLKQISHVWYFRIGTALPLDMLRQFLQAKTSMTGKYINSYTNVSKSNTSKALPYPDSYSSFCRYDVDNSGYIDSKEELLQLVTNIGFLCLTTFDMEISQNELDTFVSLHESR